MKPLSKRELETSLGAVRGEYGPEDSAMVRNDNEHPEQSYRRGFQQGAHEVYRALCEANVLDERTLLQLRKFVGVIGDWRFAQRRRLERHLVKDRTPRLEIKTAVTLSQQIARKALVNV